MLASVAFFMWVRTWKFRSTAVNWISASVFSVYLIHCNPFVWGRLISFLKAIQANYGSWQTAFLVFSAMLVFYFVCILIDKVRFVIYGFLVGKTTGIGIFIHNNQLARFE